MELKPIFPVSKYLTVTQGYKSSHVGNDYGWTSRVAGGCNQPIVAVEAGTVVAAVDGYGNTYPRSRIYGNYVTVSHGGGVYSLYGHLLKGLAVKKGQTVRKGQVLGYMGNSGYSNGQHLHFEYRVGGNSKAYAKDPLVYLRLEDPAPVVSDASLYRDRILSRRTTVGTPTERHTSVDQLHVVANNLNARTAPSINADRLGYMTEGYYDVLSEARAGSYTWYEVEPDVWCALVKGAGEFMSKREPKLYTITVSPVSGGDRETVEKLCEKLRLKFSAVEIKEAKGKSK